MSHNLRRRKEYNRKCRGHWYSSSVLSLRWDARPAIPQRKATNYCWRKPHFRSVWSAARKNDKNSVVVYYFTTRMQNIRSPAVNAQSVCGPIFFSVRLWFNCERSWQLYYSVACMINRSIDARVRFILAWHALIYIAL